MADSTIRLPVDGSGVAIKAWTSNVTAGTPAHTHTVSGTYYPSYPGQGQPANPYGGSFGPYQPAAGSPSIFVSTQTQPLDGTIAVINGELMQYHADTNLWELVQTSEEVEAPKLPIELDTSGMLSALREYRDFLDDLDGLDQKYADAVSDTLFGLRESIEALERIEQA